MHKSRLGALIIDCRTHDLPAQARFWGAALGYKPVPPKAGWDGKYIDLAGPEGELKIMVQRVDHENRVHLDIETDNFAAEIARLEQLGAKRLKNFPRWTVMEAPSGHRFCIINPQWPNFAEKANAWP
ncbi:MAG TPA: VOC family protein [Alphaproteobacteria bacterium]|nr:VOC family protein [Alphaproteobacteria bacterium]